MTTNGADGGLQADIVEAHRTGDLGRVRNRARVMFMDLLTEVGEEDSTSRGEGKRVSA